MSNNIILPNLKSSFGSINWHLPLILKTVGKERIRTLSDVNKELPCVFIEQLKECGINANITNLKTLEYSGETYEKRKASKRYLIVQIYSLAIPTAISLGVLSQQRPQEMLTFTGRKLLKILSKNNSNLINDDEESMNMFRQIFVLRDKKWKILESISKLKTNATIENILIELNKQNIKPNVNSNMIIKKIRKDTINTLTEKGIIRNSSDRERLSPQIEKKIHDNLEIKLINDSNKILQNILLLYKNLNILDKSKDVFILNHQLLNNLKKNRPWNDINNIENEEFFEILKNSYFSIKSNDRQIPIPIIRDKVCSSLEITWFDFDKKFIQLGYEFKGYRIALSKAIYSKNWGINIENNNYYYMSILE